MIIKVYSRHIEDARGTRDGDFLTKAYRGTQEVEEV
jgi:hypothetical protein